MAHALAYEDTLGGKVIPSDPFWNESAVMLYMALIGYLFETEDIKESAKNMVSLIKLINEADREESSYRESRGRSPLDERMKSHAAYMKICNKESWALERYKAFNSSPNKTHQTIKMTALAKMATFDTLETRRLLSGNDINFEKIGQKPTALFVQVSDTDRSMDVLVNLFYTQLMNVLCSYADDHCENSCLPVPVQFILDDFATNARIDNFQNMIANIRSRGISAMIMVQSESQLVAGYGIDAQTIIDNCNTYVYMGGSNPLLADLVAKRANKLPNNILNMPISTSWIFRRGEELLASGENRHSESGENSQFSAGQK